MPKAKAVKVKKVARTYVSFRLEKDVLDVIDKKASEEGRTRSNQIERILADYLKDRRGK